MHQKIQNLGRFQKTIAHKIAILTKSHKSLIDSLGVKQAINLQKCFFLYFFFATLPSCLNNHRVGERASNARRRAMNDLP